jgi:hypothetical protein
MAALGLGAVLAAVWARPAHALELSKLEQRMVTRALGDAPDRDDAPDGKRIESVEIRRLPVFDEDDPVPDFVNYLHAQSREHVIRRELLFAPGDRYDAELVEETIRNLQLIPQFGVVAIVALRSRDPQQVRLVVLVRDIWSLRLAYQLQGSFSYINYLLINPIETNLFGTRTSVGGLFTLRSDRYAVGGVVGYPRVAGSKLDAFAQAAGYVNLESGESEGSFGVLSLRRDFASLKDKWAFLTGVSWLNEQTRLLSTQSGVHITSDRIDIQNRLLESHGIPVEFGTRILRAGVEVARSFGKTKKTIITWGLELNRRRFAAEQPEDATDAAYLAFLRDEVPVSDTRLSPFVQLEQRTTRFLATRDVETLELQESYSLGEQATLRIYPALHDAGSSRTLLGSAAWLGYTWPLRDGLLRVLAGSNIEYADLGRHQASAQVALRVVSPQLRFLRLVLDYAAAETYQNYLNRKLSLGGDSHPRGYINGGLRGGSGYAGTLELRTSAVNIFSARVGLAGFYDAGGTGDSIASASPHHAIGAGVRLLLPQINRQVFRLDWAVPLTPSPERNPNRALPGVFYFSFGQAFDVPRLRPPETLSGPSTVLDLTQ